MSEQPASRRVAVRGLAVSPATAATLMWAGWLVVLACALLRVQTAFIPFPYWDVDPTYAEGTMLGLAPVGSVLVDIIMMLGAGVALLGSALHTPSMHPAATICTILAAIGAVGLSLHAWVLPTGTIEDVRIGASWLSAIIAGLAAFVICREERLRRLTVAIGIGIVILLAAKGVLQVFLEHPMTVDRYAQDREAFLRAQGWLPDSPQALAFERRLRQAEATGWFGMANVFASFAAAGSVALIGFAAVAWREARLRGTLPDGWAGLVSCGAVAATVSLILAGGKGGFAAAALGIGLLGVGALIALWRNRKANAALTRAMPSRWGGMLAVGVVLAALLAVVLRGMIGERIGDLSLLFRWFYIQGAVRISLEHPITGVAPSGFKDAYLLAKPALSPEEVSSPHSILLDWASTLGLAGLAWCAAWLIWVWFTGVTGLRSLLMPMSAYPAGAESSSRRGSFSTPEERTDARFVVAIITITMLIGMWLEQAGLIAEAALMRVVGAAGSIGVALAMLAVMRITAWHRVGAASALVLAAHAQIEVTPVWPGSAALFMILIASIAAPPSVSDATADANPPWTLSARFIPAAFALSAGVLWAWMGLVPVARWQGDLYAAYRAVQPVTEIRTRIARLEAGQPTNGDTWPRVVGDLAGYLGAPPAPNPDTFSSQLDELVARSAIQAQVHLESAMLRSRGHTQTIEALTRVMRLRAVAQQALGHADRARETLSRAESIVDEAAASRPSASLYGILGNILADRAALERNPAHLERAIEAWMQAAELDPYGLTFPLRIFRTLEQLGEASTPRGTLWARRILQLDERLRLDPVKQLPESERSRLQSLLARTADLP